MVPLRPLLTPDASLGTIDLPVLRQTIRTHRPPPPAGVAANGEHAADCAPHPQDRQCNPCGQAAQSVPGEAIRARPATVSVVRLGAPLARLVCAHSNTSPGQPRSAAADREPSKGRTMTLHMPAETAAQDRVWMAFPSSGYAL